MARHLRDMGVGVRAPIVVCSRAFPTTPNELRRLLQVHLPGLRILVHAAIPNRLVALLRELAAIGGDPGLRQCKWMSGQELLNNASVIVASLGRTIPTLLILTDVAQRELEWLPSPAPPGLRIAVFLRNEEIDSRSWPGGMRTSSAATRLVHFSPTSFRLLQQHPLKSQLEVLASSHTECKGYSVSLAACAKLYAEVSDVTSDVPVTQCVHAALDAAAAALAALSGDRVTVARTVEFTIRVVCQFPGALTLEQLVSLLAHIHSRAKEHPGHLLSRTLPDAAEVKRIVDMLSPMLGDESSTGQHDDDRLIGDAHNEVVAKWLPAALDQRGSSPKHASEFPLLFPLLCEMDYAAVFEWLKLPPQRKNARLWVQVAVPMLLAVRDHPGLRGEMDAAVGTLSHMFFCSVCLILHTLLEKHSAHTLSGSDTHSN